MKIDGIKTLTIEISIKESDIDFEYTTQMKRNNF